jgi:hypothetical protein
VRVVEEIITFREYAAVETTTWWNGIISSLKSQTATWLVALLIALLSIFSSQITERVKLALNRADLTSKYYEELASDLRVRPESSGRIA